MTSLLLRMKEINKDVKIFLDSQCCYPFLFLCNTMATFNYTTHKTPGKNIEGILPLLHSFFTEIGFLGSTFEVSFTPYLTEILEYLAHYSQD